MGIGLLLLVAIVRFLLQPLFQIPFDQGTNWVSLTILLPITMVIYAVAVARRGGTFRDLLVLAALFAFSAMLFVILGIAVDDFGGIDTYYTGPQEANTWGHMFGHVVEGVIFTLLLWGIGSVVYLVAGGRKRAASVDSPL
ncbi:MAG: hypothetical protein O7D93_12425 [Acidobacteria bacterium]|nr:hypothetical protein [Acidobacteriota bacterium]